MDFESLVESKIEVIEKRIKQLELNQKEIASIGNVTLTEEEHSTTPLVDKTPAKPVVPTNFDMNVERTPSLAETLLAKASHAQRTGKFEEAIKFLEESEKAFSKTAEQTRSTLKTSGGFSKLIRRDSVREDEKFIVTIQLKRATLYNKLGNHKEALTILNTTIPLIGNEITTESWKSQREKAIALSKLNLHEQAIESFDKSLDLIMRRRDATEINVKMRKVIRLREFSVLASRESNKYCFQCLNVVNQLKNEPKQCIRVEGYFHPGERGTVVKNDDEKNLDYYEEWKWSCCSKIGSRRDNRINFSSSFYNDAPGCQLKRTHFPSHQFV